MYLAGRECMELDENEQNWTGREWIGRTQTSLGGLDTGQEYTSAEWTGLDWVWQHFRGLNWMALHFTGQECLSLSLNSPDFTRLHYSTLDWTGKYHTGQSAHCTSLDWSAPNCIARFQMKLTKTVLHCTWMYSTGLDYTGELCTALEVT